MKKSSYRFCHLFCQDKYLLFSNVGSVKGIPQLNAPPFILKDQNHEKTHPHANRNNSYHIVCIYFPMKNTVVSLAKNLCQFGLIDLLHIIYCSCPNNLYSRQWKTVSTTVIIAHLFFPPLQEEETSWVQRESERNSVNEWPPQLYALCQVKNFPKSIA